MILGLATDENDGDSLAGILGRGCPDDLVGLSSGDLLVFERVRDDVKSRSGVHSEDSARKGEDGGDGETHIDGVCELG